jgi:hypothetical protein|tara:strand:+ start:277 stop:1302 length:1026 start_codon:yes stop_codon:yes gene_type:complete
MENAVTRGAAPAEPMQTMAGVSYEDLGGPTPENYRPDDDSAKLKDPSGEGGHAKNLKSVKGALSKEEAEVEETEIIAEDEATEEEVVEETVEETVAEELPEITDDVDVEEDVNALLGGQELSEEFRDKAKTIFEAALKSKVTEIREALEARYEAQLVEEVEAMKGELVERVDSYLEYVADEWITENAIAVEHGLRTEMTESFLEGMKGLFENHYVTIPEEKYDVVESMVDKLDEMETKLNEQIEKNISINKRLSEATAGGILSDVAEGLTTVQKDKLASLAEGVEFESEESYKEKLETLKESYFKSSPKRSESEVLTESTDQDVSGSMAAYMQVLSRSVQK